MLAGRIMDHGLTVLGVTRRVLLVARIMGN